MKQSKLSQGFLLLLLLAGNSVTFASSPYSSNSFAETEVQQIEKIAHKALLLISKESL